MPPQALECQAKLTEQAALHGEAVGKTAAALLALREDLQRETALRKQLGGEGEELRVALAEAEAQGKQLSAQLVADKEAHAKELSQMRAQHEVRRRA